MSDVADFLENLLPERRRSEAVVLDGLFRRTTGWEPRLWRGGILGYGCYEYTYASGRSGQFLATGFAPGKARLSIHIMPGYADYSAILDRLGKHKTGKSCVYVNKISDVDMDVLAKLIRAGLKDLRAQWPVGPS